MFDAYTIKKVVPRLVAAVILIQLSWFIFTTMLAITNDIAFGIEGLLYAPFGGASHVTLSNLINTLAGSNGAGTGLFTAMVIGGAGAGLVAMSVVGVMSLALAALIGLLMALFVLVLRRALLVALIIVAPIALVAWILPGTEKYWKLWWESFSKLLLLFPLILLIIAAGRVLAFTVIGVGGASGGVTESTVSGVSEWVLVIVCFFGPYFLIPKTFQMAGSAFGNLTGMVNDRGKGVFDRLRKGRQARIATNIANMKTGDRFQNRNALTRQFNKRSSGLAGGFKSGFGFGGRGEAYHDLHGRAAAEEAIKNNPNLRQLAYDDNAVAVMALSGGNRAGAERIAARLQAANGWTDDQRVRAVQTAAATGFNGSNVTAAMTLMAQNKSRALSGDLAGEAGMDLVRESAAQVSGGNAQMTENMMGGFAFNSRNAGRLDLGGEFAGRSLLDGWQRSSVAQHAQSFGTSMQSYTNQVVPLLNNGTAEEREAAATALLEMQ